MRYGIIYKITNILNNKVYIGQTIMTLKSRWNKHKSKSRYSNEGLYGAMQKYGIENFIIEEIIKCPVEELNNLERYYISLYNSYEDGYNRTLGGDAGDIVGARYLNEEDVINKYQELKYITDTAKFFNSCPMTISNILHRNNIEIVYKPKITGNTRHNLPIHYKKIIIVELNKTFDSLLECGQWLIDNKYSNASTANYARKSISRALTGERPTYCGFHFEYL